MYRCVYIYSIYIYIYRAQTDFVKKPALRYWTVSPGQRCKRSHLQLPARHENLSPTGSLCRDSAEELGTSLDSVLMLHGSEDAFC